MTLRLLAAAAAAAVLSATVAAPAEAADVPDDLVEVQTRTSPLGTHTWYRQTFHGLRVVDGYYTVHDLKGEGESTIDGRKSVPADLRVKPGVGSAAALTKASSHISQKAARISKSGQLKNREVVPEFGKGKADLAVYDGTLVWDVIATSSTGSTETFIDAATGAVNGSRVLSKNVEGTGKVFAPNPVQKLQDETLTDQNDIDAAVPSNGYSTKPMSHLDTSHTLKGKYVKVVESSVPLAQSLTDTYEFPRSDDRFEQVNAYYGLDLAQSRLVALGFGRLPKQWIRVNTYSADQSFYSSADWSITFGTGGVDDAEDLDIVWHEFGHAIQDAFNPGFGPGAGWSDAKSVGEGFGDYWAVSMSKPTGGGFEDACVGDWDSVSYTPGDPVHCLRRTDTDKIYPDDLEFKIHDDGEIWSRALWEIFQTLGRGKTDSIALGGNILMAPNTSMPNAAKCTVKAANILYGTTIKTTVKSVFASRGLGGGTCV